MRDVFIAGEDEVTKAVIERLIKDYAPDLNILSSLPARGSQLKSKMKEFNVLSCTHPVVVLTDLDAEFCAPIEKSKLLEGLTPSPDLIINIAIDEAEAWLMADKAGFANYFGLPLNEMPESTLQRMSGRKALPEMCFPIKASLHLTKNLMQKSYNVELKAQIAVSAQAKNTKGPEYNTAVVPFIRSQWDPEVARVASDSLNRMIVRLQSI